MVITGVVANDMNSSSLRVLSFDLLKQLDCRLGVNGVVITNDGAEIAAIDDAIDVESLPPGITANFVILPALDPAVAGNRIVIPTGHK